MENTQRIKQQQAGFTLIEVLIAMLVIAIGVMGVAALQFQALKYNHDAYLRSQINVLANDIIDRIRLNSENVANYEGNYIVDSTSPTCNQSQAPDAVNDLACWRRAVNAALPPGGGANIAASGTLHEVTLSWTSRDANAATEVSYTFQP